MSERLENVKKGIEWDPIPRAPRRVILDGSPSHFCANSSSRPTRHGWSTKWSTISAAIYTDGRDHIPEADRYPLYNGDSVGFWDGHRLVIHTNQLQGASTSARSRITPIRWRLWRSGRRRTTNAAAPTFGSTILRRSRNRGTPGSRTLNEGTNLRIRYWHCGENQNNAVFRTREGATEFRDFTFNK